jgi:flagellar L-ring protein FlgH
VWYLSLKDKGMRRTICIQLLMAALLVFPLTVQSESLYQEKNFRSIVSDRKAYRPGDGLTVLILENASATPTADTSTEKSGGLGLSVKSTDYAKAATINLNDDFSGKGKIQRSGKLLAQITVTVQSVENNGDLHVMGEQQIEVNDEKQFIKLEGRVRPSDISDTNTIPSNRLADARISYVGDGILGEKQRPGVLTRVLSWLGLL